MFSVGVHRLPLYSFLIFTYGNTFLKTTEIFGRQTLWNKSMPWLTRWFNVRKKRKLKHVTRTEVLINCEVLYFHVKSEGKLEVNWRHYCSLTNRSINYPLIRKNNRWTLHEDFSFCPSWLSITPWLIKDRVDKTSIVVILSH